MNKEKVREIIKFSFFKDLQNKWFIIFNVLSLVSILILINFSNFTSLFNVDKEEVYNIEILDNANSVYDALYVELEDNNLFNVSKINENNYNAENILDNQIIIEIKTSEDENLTFSIISKEGIKKSTYTEIKDALKHARNELIANNNNISKEKLALFQSEVEINRVMLAVDAEDSSIKDYIKFISSALTYLIATVLFSKLSNEIAQEKQSKSSEYILTTVSAKEYLFAKVFSNIAVVVIQGLFLMIYYYIAALVSRLFTIGTSDLSFSLSTLSSAISTDVVIYIFVLLVFNILNIILLSIIQATLSAKTASTTEAGNTMSIIMFLMIIAYVVSSIVIDPLKKTSIIIQAVACLPLVSAFFIPALLVIGQCSLWQIIISLLLLIIAIPLTFNYCSNIFKNGILDYTKSRKKCKDNNRVSKYLIKREIKELGFVIGLAIIIYVGIQSIFSLIASVTLKPLFGAAFNDAELSLFLQIILQIMSLGTAGIFVLSYCKRQNSSNALLRVRKISKIKLIFISIFLVFLLQIILGLWLYPKIGLDYDVVDMFNISSSSRWLTKFIAIIGMALIPAIFEELFFRKAVIDYTFKYGKRFALVFSALLFGLLHMNISQGLFAFIMGLILGFIYLYTNDIKITMLIHFINNCFATLAMILPNMWVLLLSAILLGCMITGLVFVIKCFRDKEIRRKLVSYFTAQISRDSITKFKYLFADYTFDVSIILVVLMSILTENLLR